MEPTSSTVTDGARTGLVEVVFQFKNAVEDRAIDRVKALFAPRPEICVQGHFMTLGSFLERLQAFFMRVEHVAMDVTRIDEVDQKDGFVSVEVEFAWIDSQLWEEQTVRGDLALTIEPKKVNKRRGREDGEAGDPSSQINGLSYAMRRDALDERNGGGGNGGDGNGGDRPPGGGTTGTGAGPTGDRGYDPLGSIWG